MKKTLIILGSLAIVGGAVYFINEARNKPSLEVYDNIKKTAVVYHKGKKITVDLGKGLALSMGKYTAEAIKDDKGVVTGVALKKNDKTIQTLRA